METLDQFPLATISVAFNLPALYFVATVMLTLTAQLTLRKYRQIRLAHTVQQISNVITDYFGATGIEVSVSCFSLLEGLRFVAVIESEPVKKFRHSYIIEQVLIRHVMKSTGQQLEKIYWRFPFTPASEDQETPAAIKHPDMTDPYHAEGPAQTWVENGYRVEETSWENYANAVNSSHQAEAGLRQP